MKLQHNDDDQLYTTYNNHISIQTKHSLRIVTDLISSLGKVETAKGFDLYRVNHGVVLGWKP